jgi:hypothetical protein
VRVFSVCGLINYFFIKSKSLLVAAHSEIFWWIHANITSYRESQVLVLPKCDDVSLFSMRPWQTYWLRLKERVLPSVMRHQATLGIFNFYRILLSLVVRKETYLKCTQNPHPRALARNETGCDRLELGLQMVGVCFASNLLFFLAECTVGQLQLLVVYYQRWLQRLDEELPTILDRHRSDEEFETVSVALARETIHRYWYSSVGAGLGSILWPGMGTLMGVGLGDALAQQMTTPTTSPTDAGGGAASSGLKRIWESAPMIFPTSFTSPRKTKHDDDGADDGFEKTHDTLLCGCCQIATFSSHARDRTPIASSACGHSICQSCVQKCHLVLCERTSHYEEWIKCPLCNAPKAFHAYNHVVNRSLCDVLQWVEDKMEKG